MDLDRSLGKRVDLVQPLHASTKRDYVGRVVEHDKARCAEVATHFGRDYWDGERCYGYGGYRYDGRWHPIARLLAERYSLRPGMRVLDVGCGKGHLLFELTKVVPGLVVAGADISDYAIANAKAEIRSGLVLADAARLPFEGRSFDFVYSLATFHNLPLPKLWAALGEVERVARAGKYIMVESFRNEREKMNLLYWQLTCRSFYAVEDWEWLYVKAGYRGDYGFIFFE